MTSMTRTIHPMIRLEHANLVVKDIQPTLEFLLTAFPHWRVRGRGLDAIYEFAFIGGSLKLRGADAAPIRPIAIPVR